jgi:AcrR family transcriptional regulator
MPPKAKAETTTVWDRPADAERATPKPLHRDEIVRAAIALADAEGLEAVSLRKVAGALNAGPMRLYTHFSTKEELLELMVDVVYGEMTSTRRLRGNCREVLRAIALRLRASAGRHPWFVQLFVGRPHVGPNAFAHREASLSALVAAGLTIDGALQAMRTVSAYVVGAVLSEYAEAKEQAQTGLTKSEWQEASWPHVRRMLASGAFPTLAKVVESATHVSAEEGFEAGLACVLDGIAARVGGARGTARDGANRGRTGTRTAGSS